MDATVTLKLTPAEFDGIRRALKTAQAEESRRVDVKKDATGDDLLPAAIRTSRQRVVEYHDLHERLS